MSAATKEEQLEQSIQFLASEIREVKKKVEIHTHNIEQLVRAVRTINEWQDADTKHDEARIKIEEIRCQRDEVVDEELNVIKNRISTIESKTIPLPFQFERDLAAEVDDLKLRLNEIQAKSHRKFPASGEKGPNSLDNME